MGETKWARLKGAGREARVLMLIHFTLVRYVRNKERNETHDQFVEHGSARVTVNLMKSLQQSQR